MMHGNTLDWYEIELLIHHHASIQISKNDINHSLLWLAFNQGKHEVVFALLNQGIDIQEINGYDRTTDVHRATSLLDCTGFLELLLEYDQSAVNALDSAQRTPLIHYIDLIGQSQILDNHYDIYKTLDLLMAKGANLNALDLNGNNCLNHAYFDSKLITHLINHGANIYNKNKQGVSVIISLLSNLSQFSLVEGNHKHSKKLIEMFLNEMNYDRERVIRAAFSTMDKFTNLTATFDLIFYGVRNKSLQITDLGWSIFEQLFSNENSFDVKKLFKVIFLSSFHDDDTVYFIQNFGVGDMMCLMSFVFKYSFLNNVNVKRGYALLYYVLNLNKTHLRQVLIENVRISRDIYQINEHTELLQLPANLVFKRPFRLKTLCRTKVRSMMKSGFHLRLQDLLVPACLKSYLMYSELKNFISIQHLDENFFRHFIRCLSEL